MPSVGQGSTQRGNPRAMTASSHSDLALIPSDRPPSSETTGPRSLDSEGSSSTGRRPGATTAVAPRSASLADAASLEDLLASLPYSLTRLVDVDSDEWRKPESLTAGEIQAAKGRLGRAEALLRPADKQLLKRWLSALGVLCAGQMTAADAKAKIGAYVPLLDAPAAVLTKRTLQDAGRQFKWFPSFAELSEFLDGQSWVMCKLAARLKMLAESTPALEHQPGSDWKELSQAQRDEIDRKIAAAKRAIADASEMLKGGKPTQAGVDNTPECA